MSPSVSVCTRWVFVLDGKPVLFDAAAWVARYKSVLAVLAWSFVQEMQIK
jgi:hypothetical protein